MDLGYPRAHNQGGRLYSVGLFPKAWTNKYTAIACKRGGIEWQTTAKIASFKMQADKFLFAIIQSKMRNQAQTRMKTQKALTEQALVHRPRLNPLRWLAYRTPLVHQLKRVELYLSMSQVVCQGHLKLLLDP